MEQDYQVFKLYTPFRNQLRQYNIIDRIYVIWGYSRNLSKNLPIPEDIEYDRIFLTYSKEIRALKGIAFFEQVFLYKECLLHCSNFSSQNKLKKRANLAKIVNYLRLVLHEKVDMLYMKEEEIFKHLFRISHRQFIWQEINDFTIWRYYRIFSQPSIDALIQKNTGLSVREIVLLGIILYDHFLITFCLSKGLEWVKIDSIGKEKFKCFFDLFSSSIREYKEVINASQEMNEHFFYA
jgi:hypothetical protein